MTISVENFSKSDIVSALVGAYHNASRQMLSSEDIEWGHRAGVRDVAVRLGVYEAFCEELNRPLIEGGTQP